MCADAPSGRGEPSLAAQRGPRSPGAGRHRAGPREAWLPAGVVLPAVRDAGSTRMYPGRGPCRGRERGKAGREDIATHSHFPPLPSPPPAVAQRKEGVSLLCQGRSYLPRMPSGAHQLVTCPPHAWVFPLLHQQRQTGEGAGQLVTPGLLPAEGEATTFCQNTPFWAVLASSACVSLDELVRYPIPRCPTRTAQKPTHPRVPPPSLSSWKYRERLFPQEWKIKILPCHSHQPPTPLSRGPRLCSLLSDPTRSGLGHGQSSDR